MRQLRLHFFLGDPFLISCINFGRRDKVVRSHLDLVHSRIDPTIILTLIVVPPSSLRADDECWHIITCQVFRVVLVVVLFLGLFHLPLYLRIPLRWHLHTVHAAVVAGVLCGVLGAADFVDEFVFLYRAVRFSRYSRVLNGSQAVFETGFFRLAGAAAQATALHEEGVGQAGGVLVDLLGVTMRLFDSIRNRNLSILSNLLSKMACFLTVLVSAFV